MYEVMYVHGQHLCSAFLVGKKDYVAFRLCIDFMPFHQFGFKGLCASNPSLRSHSAWKGRLHHLLQSQGRLLLPGHTPNSSEVYVCPSSASFRGPRICAHYNLTFLLCWSFICLHQDDHTSLPSFVQSWSLHYIQTRSTTFVTASFCDFLICGICVDDIMVT